VQESCFLFLIKAMFFRNKCYNHQLNLTNKEKSLNKNANQDAELKFKHASSIILLLFQKVDLINRKSTGFQ